MAEKIGTAPRKHRCQQELPQPKWFRKHPEGVQPGDLYKCSCQVVYVWEYHGYSEVWSWSRYNGKGYDA